MKIRSPPNVHYPITVFRLHKKRDEEIQRGVPLIKYTYETTIKERDRYGEVNDVKKNFQLDISATADGVITQWFIKEGTVISRPGIDICEIEEPCTHETQFGGLCVECGKDMTEMDYLTTSRDVDRATVNMTHDNVALLFSPKEAARADEEVKHRLLDQKKLSLIVDLDQTVIHTTCERTIGEWKDDPNNPNYDAVKDVGCFQLADDNVGHVAANSYYVKMRPGLKEFFDRVSQKYEMHIYTMATRAYAQEVANIIDPGGKFFGNRILSRDENYTDKLKSLQRLFPTNTDMVVIIDDRADIWHWSDNLIRVPVFNFFPGAGDINASFLPKQQELITTAPKMVVTDEIASKDELKKEEEKGTPYFVAAKPAEPLVKETNGALTEIEQQLLSMGTADNPGAVEEQVKEQEKVIIAQQVERPLLQQQLLLDKEDEEADIAEENGEHNDTQNGSTQTTEPQKHRHSLLHDDDRGLVVIEKNLNAVHRKFYDEYRRGRKVPPGGRVAELKGSPKKRLEPVVPDIKVLMPQMKHEVLEGCTIVFTGIIPQGMDVQNSDLALWVKSFGADVSTNVNKRSTHVIANPERKTAKVKKATRYPHISIVNAEWMLQCCTRWEHVDEGPYLIEVERGSPYEDDLDTDPGASDDGLDEESPLDMQQETWDDIDEEFRQFMDEDESDDTDANNSADGSDSESVRSETSTKSDSKQIKRKRKRTSSRDTSEAEDSDASSTSTSRLQRRKKRTIERVSSLTNVVSADKSSGLPSPETTGPEEDANDMKDTNDTAGELETDPDPAGLAADDSDPENDDDGLEAEMMAEFERSGSEDGA